MPTRRFVLVLALALGFAALSVTVGAFFASAFDASATWLAVAIPAALVASLIVRAAWGRGR